MKEALIVLGSILIVTGTALVYIPAGFIVAGLLLGVIAILSE